MVTHAALDKHGHETVQLLPHRHGQVVVSPSPHSTFPTLTSPTLNSWPPSPTQVEPLPLPLPSLSTPPRDTQPGNSSLSAEQTA